MLIYAHAYETSSGTDRRASLSATAGGGPSSTSDSRSIGARGNRPHVPCVPRAQACRRQGNPGGRTDAPASGYAGFSHGAGRDQGGREEVIVIDTTILSFAVGTDHPFRDPTRRLVSAIAARRVEATTTPEVIQEFAHVRARRRDRADAVAVAQRYAEL